VNRYYASYGGNEVQSAVNLHAPYSNLNAAVDNFAVALINGVGAHRANMVTARNNSQEFDNPEYVDLHDFAGQIYNHVSDATIRAAALDVTSAVNTAVIRERHGSSWPGAHGISIYFPESEVGYDIRYDGSQGWLQFTANTQWDEWLHAFYTGVAYDNWVFLPLVMKQY